MARKRMIDPDFWTDEALGTLPVHGRLLFMGLISNADDEGRLRGNPALVRSSVFPYDDFTSNDVAELLNGLESAGLIRQYEVDGQSYIDIPNFLKHQTINKPTPSKLPPYKEEKTTTEPLPGDDGSPTVVLPPKLREEKLREEKLREEKLSLAPKPAREREPDLLFEAIAEAWKGEPYHAGLLTNGQRSLVGKATAEIRAIRGSPEDVPREWQSLRERFDNPTPAALAKHWGTNGTGPKHEQSTDPIANARSLIERKRKSGGAGGDAGSVHDRPQADERLGDRALGWHVPSISDGRT